MNISHSRQYREADVSPVMPNPFPPPLQYLMSSATILDQENSWYDNSSTVYTNVNAAELAILQDHYAQKASFVRGLNLGMSHDESMDMQAAYSYSPPSHSSK